MIEDKIQLGIPLAWILHSLDIIKKENDAPLVGGFTGAVMNILGRILLFPDGEGNDKSKICFYEFIEKYLKECNYKYLIHKETLWRFMRCDGAHTVLPQYAVVFSGDPKDEKDHLEIIYEPFGRVLLVFTPKFIDDLHWCVEKFYYNLQQEILLKTKHDKVIDKLLSEGQEYINKNFPAR